MITDEQRHQLFTKARDVFGREEAAIFMEAISPTPVAGLEHRMDLFAAELRHVESRLDSRIIQQSDQQTKELQRTFVTWLLTSQTTVVAAIALIIGLR